ncbi:MAG: porin [Endozoicomonas sp.]
MHKKILAAAIAATMATSAMALEVYNDDTNSLSIGGRIGLSMNDNDKSVDNDSSRINFKYGHNFGNGWTGAGVVEWSFDTVAKSGDDVFGNRLGFVELAHDDLGTFRGGKQFSVFGEIAEWSSDMMLFNGGKWIGIYDGVTGDGGFNGTGRADGAVTYRNSFGGLNVGLQAQAKDQKDGYDRKMGYGIGLSYDLPMGFSVGYAYNEAEMNKSANNLDGKNAKAQVLSAKFEMDALYVGASYGEFKHHLQQFSGMGGGLLAEKAKTYDLYASYALNNVVDGFSVYTGHQKVDFSKNAAGDSTKAEGTTTSIGAMYEVGPMLFGAQYDKVTEKDNLGKKSKDADDVFTINARYYF